MLINNQLLEADLYMRSFSFTLKLAKTKLYYNYKKYKCASTYIRILRELTLWADAPFLVIKKAESYILIGIFCLKLKHFHHIVCPTTRTFHSSQYVEVFGSLDLVKVIIYKTVSNRTNKMIFNGFFDHFILFYL